MAGRNGKGQLPRPRIEIQSATASADEAAAIAAALERILWETAPAPRPAEVSRWLRTALHEGISSRSGLGSGWGITPGA